MNKEEEAWSFERFMSEALYHPETGYYMRHISDVGFRGDFSTSATLHPAFAKAIALWAWETAPWVRGEKHFIEVGAGNGSLAQNIWKSLPFYYRPFLHYHIVEISPRLRTLQQKRLQRRTFWHSDMVEALQTCAGHAAIFSNEVPDAMPCSIFVKHQDQWRELLLKRSQDGWMEMLGAVSQQTSSAMERIATYPEAQRIEVGFAYQRWCQSWAPHWRNGGMLTIDYGSPASSLYFRRPRGTLRGYFHHQRVEGLDCYARFGRQDLTVDVNFSDLTQWGRDLDWHAHPIETQREFLLRKLPSLRKQEAQDARLAFLLHPDGAGGGFYVLEQFPPMHGLTARFL